MNKDAINEKREYNKLWRQRNPDYAKNWWAKNKDKRKQYTKTYYKKHADKVVQRSRSYRADNPDKIRSYNKCWRDNNLEKIEQWRSYNKERHNKSRSEWLKRNPHYHSEYNKRRSSVDIEFRLRSTLRARMNCVIKGRIKAGSTIKDLGCSVSEFRTYLSGKFQPGMTWSNWGKEGWHVDHIQPLSSFNLSNREEFLKACHYTNHQPLWAFDNMSKGSKINETDTTPESTGDQESEGTTE